MPNRRIIVPAAATAICFAAIAIYAYMTRPMWAKDAWSSVLWATGNAKGCSLADSVDRISKKITAQTDRAVRGSRLLGKVDGLERWQTPLGEIYNPPGNSLHFLIGEQLAGVYSIPPCRINRGDVVLDCGANVGTFTRTALDGGARLVVAVEIDPRNIRALRRTFASEIAEGRVLVIDKGVWDHEDTLELYAYDNTALNSVVMRERQESSTAPTRIRVPLTTIDKLVRELQIPAVNFIKMDIEGAERNALQGAQETIRRFHPKLVIATENLPDDIDRIPMTLRQLNLRYEQKNGGCRVIQEPSTLRPEAVCFY